MTKKPIRIQLSRKKGWRMPENTVKVTRPGKWGNPFKIGGKFMIGDPDPKAHFKLIWCQTLVDDPRFTLIQDQAQAVEWYRRLLESQPDYATTINRNISELRGKNLACWCKAGTPCHADVLLELANDL